jgi:signal transduction histidine kinase
LRDVAGKVIGFGKLLRNSTDLKEQIETLRNRAEELVRADEHKNLFLSTVSHELRNPLAPLSNALQLIRAIRPNDEGLLYPIKLIERQVEFIRRLVDDLLDVTRISVGKVQLELEPIDLRDVVTRAVESTRPLISQRRHSLVQHLLDAPLIVNADADRLEQVFINLLTNAAKYTPEGGRIEIRASTGQTEAWVHFRDNGIGIPTEMLPHVFELFTRGEIAAEQAKEGLGIGLSLVKQLVELHGGSVQVRSEGQAKGSEFTVRLPLAAPRGTKKGA